MNIPHSSLVLSQVSSLTYMKLWPCFLTHKMILQLLMNVFLM